MRLWSLHPKYLDAKGLVACWREGLLARKVLLGETRGYRNHPQLERFRSGLDPVLFIDCYLDGICSEAAVRGYKFDISKIDPRPTRSRLNVTAGQLAFELEHLKRKLETRDPSKFESLLSVDEPEAHPLFRIISGGVSTWERSAV